jgi:hypothetical protein
VSQQHSDVGFDSTNLPTAGIDRVNEAKAMHGGPIVAMLGLIMLHVLLDILLGREHYNSSRDHVG